MAIRAFLFCLLSALTTANAQEIITPNPLQGVTFQRQYIAGTVNAFKVEHYASGDVRLPAWPSPDPGRGYLTHVMATARPAGATVMWATWTFISRGLFTSNPGAHAAFIVRSLSTGLSNIGQGFIVGGLGGFATSQGGACVGGVRSQPETWHENADGTAGNRLFGGSFCGPAVQDWRPYNVTLHAAADSYSYSIYDGATGQLTFSTHVSNVGSPSLVKIEKASGFTAGIVFADTPGTSWEFEVSNLALGWF